MTAVSIKQEVLKAQKGGYAIPLIDIFNSFGIDGIMDAVTANRAPTIIALYSPYEDRSYFKGLAAYARAKMSETDVPVSLMLDHGVSFEACLQALDFGFTDVMYDGSNLPVAENIATTRRLVEFAHARGAAVEAELGYVGLGANYVATSRNGFTDPDAVETFVKETGVDFLAIAFGNAHGLYKGEPRLDFDLVKEIHDRCPIPLVMHGGTGISDEQFRKAITVGISKINYATNIINTSVEYMKKAAAASDATLYSIPAGIRTAYREWCTRLYQVFGTAGRA